ncbi:MAG: serine/threonine protein kinase [Planctomycetes bacterium]|nr:serine/threonine protein kinase [Planctomycetota bacterium]
MTDSEARDLDDLLDRLVADYSDRLARGEAPAREDVLARVPEAQHAALRRCLDLLDEGRASSRPARRELVPGSVLAGYRIVSVLGRGGMSVVYRAEQPELHRNVALKVLRPGLALESRHVERFRREALAVARLAHPNIVQIHAVFEDDGFHAIAMECVDGPTLAEVLARLPAHRSWSAQDLAEAVGDPALARHDSYERAFCAFMAPVARAVGVAHDLGIVHRDLKPSNILVHRGGRPLVADFGLAKGDGDLELSLSGEPLGTPYYMSPEQVRQSEQLVDARSDVYSLGVTLFEGLSGRRPFIGRSLADIFDAIRHGAAPQLRRVAPTRSRDAEAVVARAMARDPARRYRSALELATDLSAIAEGRATQARADESPAWRRALGVLGNAFFSMEYEYRSHATLFGLPLLHVDRGYGPSPRTGRVRVARGWVAVGQVAVGVFAWGGVAVGGVCLGGVSVGVLGMGGLALGLLVLGGVAAGGVVHGGVAAGWAAVGGAAFGHYAAGGLARGAHVLSGAVQDPAAWSFFEHWMPWVTDLFRAAGGG